MGLYLQLVVSCRSLSHPANGWHNCGLGSHYYSTTCSFTCNTGYELSGSNTRTCLSDGSWSGYNTSCGSGEQL